MGNARSRETGAPPAPKDHAEPSPFGQYLRVDFDMPRWMLIRLTALAAEQKVDPRTLILQAIGDYLTTR